MAALQGLQVAQGQWAGGVISLGSQDVGINPRAGIGLLPE